MGWKLSLKNVFGMDGILLVSQGASGHMGSELRIFICLGEKLPVGWNFVTRTESGFSNLNTTTTDLVMTVFN